MKRKVLSVRSSRRIFRKGNKVAKKNRYAGVGMQGIMRGGIRL